MKHMNWTKSTNWRVRCHSHHCFHYFYMKQNNPLIHSYRTRRSTMTYRKLKTFHNDVNEQWHKQRLAPRHFIILTNTTRQQQANVIHDDAVVAETLQKLLCSLSICSSVYIYTMCATQWTEKSIVKIYPFDNNCLINSCTEWEPGMNMEWKN